MGPEGRSTDVPGSHQVDDGADRRQNRSPSAHTGRVTSARLGVRRFPLFAHSIGEFRPRYAAGASSWRSPPEASQRKARVSFLSPGQYLLEAGKEVTLHGGTFHPHKGRSRLNRRNGPGEDTVSYEAVTEPGLPDRVPARSGSLHLKDT